MNKPNTLESSKKRKATEPLNGVKRAKKSGRCFACLLCPKTFNMQPNLNFHVSKVHSSDVNETKKTKPVKPSVTKTIPNRVKAAKKKKRNKRRFNCALCSRSFFMQPNLNSHIAKAHATGIDEPKKTKSAKRFNCPLCSSAFNVKPNLTTHFDNAHTRDAEISCFICNTNPMSSWHEFKLHQSTSIHQRNAKLHNEQMNKCLADNDDSIEVVSRNLWKYVYFVF